MKTSPASPSTTASAERWGGAFETGIPSASRSPKKTAAETTDPAFLKNVIIHELIHTVPGCWNHGDKFQAIAALVNRKLGHHVTVTSSAETLEAAGITPIGNQTAKYALVCKKCGKTVAYRQRKCYLTEKPGAYRHSGCGGDLYTITLDSHYTIAAFK